MGKDIVGSIAAVNIGGYAFRAAGDSDIKDGKPEYKNSGEVVSGGGVFRKMEAQDNTVEGVSLRVNDEELERLKEFAKSADDLNLSYTLRSGSVYRGQGFIDFDGRQTMTGKVDVKMTSVTGWTYFGG